MSNKLTIKKNSPPSLLDIRLNEDKYPRLYQYKLQDAQVRMAEILMMASQYKGQRFNAEDIRFCATALLAELLEPNNIGTRNITFEEIRKVVKDAVLTDKEFFINVASVYRAIVAYVKGEGHQLSLQVGEIRKGQLMRRLPTAMIEGYANKMIKK